MFKHYKMKRPRTKNANFINMHLVCLEDMITYTNKTKWKKTRSLQWAQADALHLSKIPPSHPADSSSPPNSFSFSSPLFTI